MTGSLLLGLELTLGRGKVCESRVMLSLDNVIGDGVHSPIARGLLLSSISLTTVMLQWNHS